MIAVSRLLKGLSSHQTTRYQWLKSMIVRPFDLLRGFGESLRKLLRKPCRAYIAASCSWTRRHHSFRSVGIYPTRGL